MPDEPDAEPEPEVDVDRFLGARLLAEVRLARWEARVAAAIERVLAALKVRCTADVRGLTAAGWVDEPGVDPLLDQVIAAEIDPVVRAVFVAVGQVLAAGLGIGAADMFGEADFDRQVVRLASRVRDMGLDMARQVGAALRQGTARGESVPDLAARVQDTFGANEYRATTIARTEVVSAVNGASDDAARVVAGSGVELRKRWLATRDSRTRSTHVDADGQVVAMDQEFAVGGATLRYPGDPNGPAAEVVNCRCTTLYEPVEAKTT